jgi:xanthine/uracil/vitamin C permease (AzgA family)
LGWNPWPAHNDYYDGVQVSAILVLRLLTILHSANSHPNNYVKFNRNRAAFVLGIGFVTFISWFRGTAITYFPDTDAGNDRFEYFKKVVSVESLDKVWVPFTSDLSRVGIALFTFLYVDFLDTTVSNV